MPAYYYSDRVQKLDKRADDLHLESLKEESKALGAKKIESQKVTKMKLKLQAMRSERLDKIKAIKLETLCYQQKELQVSEEIKLLDKSRKAAPKSKDAIEIASQETVS